MKLTFKFGLLALVTLLLAACEITITPSPGFPDDLDIRNASFETDYEADMNGDGDYEFVICDDRTTNLTYRFTFSGDLDRWESYLRGETGGEVGRETLTLNSSYVRYDPDSRSVRVNYEIRPRGAPDIVAPQDIVVVPKVDRYVRLYLQIDGYRDAYDLTSKRIPVLKSCG